VEGDDVGWDDAVVGGRPPDGVPPLPGSADALPEPPTPGMTHHSTAPTTTTTATRSSRLVQ